MTYTFITVMQCLTWWTLSFQWSIVPRPTPLAYSQSLRPPDWESGSHGNHSTAPEAAASFDTRTWGLLSQCGSLQVPSSHFSAPSVTCWETYEMIGSFWQKLVSKSVFCFELYFLSRNLGKTFRCFLYLCESRSLILETSFCARQGGTIGLTFYLWSLDPHLWKQSPHWLSFFSL